MRKFGTNPRRGFGSSARLVAALVASWFMACGVGGETEVGVADTGELPAVTCPPPPAGSGPFSVDATGVTFTLGSARQRLQVCQDDIIRVTYTPGSSFPAKTSLSVNKVWPTPSFCVTYAAPTLTVTTDRMKAKVNTNTGSITYTDLNDAVVLAEDATRSKIVTGVTVEGVGTNRIETIFASPTSEALFGLGQHQDNVMNRKGTNRRILNVNTEINVPLLVSNRGYGIFWDNYSTSDFYGADSGNTRYRYVSEAGEMVDYYFFYGPSLDRVVANYRTATGTAPLFPKWAYGLFQSKDKYASQSELLAVKDGYRNNRIPLDVIVQDWDYWTPYSWGSHFMDEARYPNPTTLVNNMHSANVHTMISIWPVYQQVANPRKAGDQDNYNALNAIGALYPSGGSHHFYDTFNSSARTLVYQQIYNRLIGNYGWDAIWADNTEPQAYPDPLNMRAANTALGKGAFFINAYPLQHAKALYEGWRSIGPSGKRVYVLTRSAFAGQQRYATTLWSGDIDCTFPVLARQVPAGLNFAAAGMPYWTTDIGGYWGHSITWSTAANNELFTRWFQYGAFSPIFRIHGGGSRELYGNQWSATTKANLLTIDNLRYRLMPYIYSLAWRVTSEHYTIMRPLVFDYQNDANVFNIKDQFLFGPAFLVNPVVAAGVTSRNVYLPAGTWYNFWTGATVNGGASVSVSAPLSQIPLFVKAGSVVPMGPMIQYATQSIDPVEIRVYRGRDGTFTLYEDQGDTYGYESGQYSTIPFTWNEATQQLTIGARSGSYTGMPATRTFNVVFVAANRGAGVEVSTADQTVAYSGAAVVVSAGGTTNGVSINAGGSASGSFGADAYFTGGSTYSVTTAVDTSQLGGTAPPQSVLQTERYGEFTYTIPGLTAGNGYAVTLYFDEVFWTAAGQRTFNVAINGATVLTAFDIFTAAGGTNRAIARSFAATANASGQVVISFTRAGGPDNPKVCGITVVPSGISYTLTVSKAGTGAGTVTGGPINCGATCSATVAGGTSVTLTATAASGSTFTGWSGACTGTGTCAVSMTAARSVTATFTPTGTTFTNSRIVGVQSQRCVDINGNSTANGTQAQIWDCNGGSNQSWTYDSSQNLVVYGNKCLQASGGATSTGTAVVIGDCTGQAYQRWNVNSNATITNAQTGLCLDVNAAGTANGSKLILWTCHGGTNQQWSPQN